MLVRLAAEDARAVGAEVQVVDLRDLGLPLYDGDLEAASGLPEGAKKLKGLMRESQGFLIASPEYNSAMTGVMKNAIDWVSRPESDDEPPLVAFRGKVAALMAASPGALGGMRGLVQVRSILCNLGTLVLTEQVTVSSAYQAFDESGRLKDQGKAAEVKGLATSLIDFVKKHAA